MPMFEWQCQVEACGHVWEGFTHDRDLLPLCPVCGGASAKCYAGRGPALIDDTVPGGFVVENIARHPMRFDSKSEFKHELAMRGMRSSGTDGIGTSSFRHLGDPGEGSDKARRIYDPNKRRMVTRSSRWV